VPTVAGAVVLPRVVPSPPGKPTRAGAAETQRLALRVARDASCWGDELAGATAAHFDALSSVWDAERTGYRPAPLADALARGGPWPEGRCVEIGSGTGALTPLLLERWPATVCVDMSAGMLSRARSGARVRADAARLPVAAGSVSVVVVGDAPLFAREVVRALERPGVVVWLNALGSGAPYFVPTDDIRAALAAASARAWRSVESEALWGRWVVLRPREQPAET
jgi:SAM-dependent methyltransferase